MIHQHEEKLQVQESDLGEGSFVPFFTYSNSTKLESEICLITVLLIMLKLSSRSLGTDQVIMTNPVSNTRCLMVGPTFH